MKQAILMLAALCLALPCAAQAKTERSTPLPPETRALEASRSTIDAVRAYASSGKRADFERALRLARHIASWNPSGATAHARLPEASRAIAWALALAYDRLSPRLDTVQKNLLLSPLRARADDLYNDPSPRARPTLAAIALLLAGEVPESKSWLEKLRREIS